MAGPYTAFTFGDPTPEYPLLQQTFTGIPGGFVASLIPSWGGFTFANGVVGVVYSQVFDLSPAPAPTTFTLVSGSLPTGLTLSSLTGDQGQIAGTPTTAGAYTFTLRATNSYGTADKTFSITITAASGGGGVTNYGYVA